MIIKLKYFQKRVELAKEHTFGDKFLHLTTGEVLKLRKNGSRIVKLDNEWVRVQA